MKNRFVLYLFLILCYGCSSSFSIDEGNHIADGQICFSTNRLSAYSLVSTKATQVVLNDLYDGFNVSCVKGTPGSDVSVWGSTSFFKVGSVFTGGRWWPDSDESYRFYAVYPSSYSITFNAAGSRITASSADDVVVAYCSSSVFGEVNDLQFEHIFARLGNVTVQGFDGYDITNVSITVIPYISGTYNMRTGEWSGKTAGSSTVIAESLGSNSNDRYMVPGGYKVKATWTATHGSYSETFSAVSTRVSLSAGYVNNITVKLGGNGPEVRVDVSLSDWEATALNAGYFPVKMPPLFSVSSEKQVEFASGNLVITMASPVSNSVARFFEHQWDVSSVSTANTGDDVDRFAWVGASGSKAGYYGMVDWTYSQYSYAYHNNTFGSVSSESLADDYGSIPSLVSSYGEGWRILSISEWSYLCQSRTKGGSCNGVGHPRYTMAKINSDTSPVYGVIIFPDGFSIETPAGVTWGDINRASAYTTICTSDGWSALETAGCVFLPQVGSQSTSSYTLYLSSTSGQDTGYNSYFTGAQSFGFGYNNSYSYSQTKTMNNARCYRYPIRMVRDY